MVPFGGQTQTLLLAMTATRWALSPRVLLLVLLLSCLSVRSEDEDEKFYMTGNLRCLRCPAGTYVSKKCTNTDTLGTCMICDPGSTYSEHPSGLSQCLRCKVCRDDEVEVSSCTVTKNAVCQCKKGTFCSPDGPCEKCEKCTTSCPPGQIIQEPCNSTSDAQCGSQNTVSSVHILVAILVPMFIFALVAACVWCFCCRKNRKGSKLMLKIDKWGCHASPAGDIEAPFLPPRYKLQLRKNIKENEVISKIFHIFLELVPINKFERFVRELGLTDNEIERAKGDNSNCYDKQYAMVLQLYRDQRFDVNTWLDKLRQNKMKKVAQQISSRLIKDELFERIDG